MPYLGQGLLDRFNLAHRLFANEFNRDVKRLGTRPASLRRESANFFGEFCDAIAHPVRDLQRHKDAHSYMSFLRTMSSACWLANQRIRLRSPAKFFCSTSV